MEASRELRRERALDAGSSFEADDAGMSGRDEGSLLMRTNMEERKSKNGGKRSKSSYPQPPSYDYLDSPNVSHSLMRHKMKVIWSRTPEPRPMPPPSSPTPVKRKRAEQDEEDH